jgi:hypothetical protein
VDGSRVARVFGWSDDLVGCSLVSGLLMRCLEPLALMNSADRVPFCFAGCLALDIYRGVPIPGLTGSPSPLIVLALVECLGVFEGSVSHAAASRVDGCGAP